MVIVRHFGKPDFFITFMANPRWPEILRELKDGQNPLDRPDLIARVFRLKTREFLANIRKGILGGHKGYLYTIKYQKQGLPHMHILLFISLTWRFIDLVLINKVICVKLLYRE
jgi:hypothetical protein